MMLKFFGGISLILLVLHISSCKNNAESLSSSDKPNILLILADDAGYADFGFMGCKDIATPNIDKIANDGIVFTDAHVSATVCSPSRAGILTGRYQQRFGHECNLEPYQSQAFDTSEVTLAEALRGAGYKTSIFGKWHLGDKPHQHPLNNGFDYFYGFIAGGRSYFPCPVQDKAGDLRAISENHTHKRFEGYLTDVLADKAIRYIHDSVRNNNPFFMYLSFNAPHTPMHAKQEDLDNIDPNHPRPVYAAMVSALDKAVGRVIQELKQKDLYNNTIIYFLSDNGGAHNNNSSVVPLKGWKGNQYEGGSRVPFVLCWKERLTQNARFNGLTSSLDIYKTSIDAAGILKTPGKPLDGVNLIPYLENVKQRMPHTELFWRKDKMATIRSDSFKLINLNDSISVLYNLAKDLGEAKNLFETYPIVSGRLLNRLRTWSGELAEPLWIEPEDWNFVTECVYIDLMNNEKIRLKDPWNKEKLKKALEKN